TRAEVRLAELEKEQSCLVKNQKKFRALAKAHKEMLELPREPKPFEGKKLELKVLRRMMEELVERRALLKQLAPHLETIIAVQQLTQEDLKKVEVAEQAADKMNDLQERLSTTQARIEMHRMTVRRIKEVKERLAELETQLADEEALKHLVHGFQDKNMKKMAIEAISQRLM
ncbi:hypothetical protein, partial [Staphylococcus aureus]